MRQWRQLVINSKLLEHLLHEDEGVELDFKQQQYPFQDVDQPTKSELLKDILAFVNAWRRSTAYILIGVEEVRGARSNVVGVSNHLDEAQLQQFVNSKTQRPVVFSYQCCSTPSGEVGIIEIPVQERPVFVTRTYGKVERDTVYLRRGSSTSVARPDEVAKMGRPKDHWESTVSPNLILNWSDVDSREDLGSSCSLRSLVLEPRLPDTFLHDQPLLSAALPSILITPDYIKEVIDYVSEQSLFRPVGLRIRNDSEMTGRRIRFVGAIGRMNGLDVRDGLADRPRLYRDLLSPTLGKLGFLRPGHVDRSPDLQEHCDRWELNIEFGDIRPRETLWADGCLFVGSTSGKGVSLEGELLGDNIGHPTSCVLEVSFEVERRAMVMDDVWPYLISGAE